MFCWGPPRKRCLEKLSLFGAQGPQSQLIPRGKSVAHGMGNGSIRPPPAVCSAWGRSGLLPVKVTPLCFLSAKR